MKKIQHVPELLSDGKFTPLTEDETALVYGGGLVAPGEATYDERATNGGTDHILVHTDNVDAT